MLYVTYCDGISCNASTHGALKMAKIGFRVKELIGGLDWWKRDGYSTAGDKAVITDRMVGFVHRDNSGVGRFHFTSSAASAFFVQKNKDMR